MESLSIASSSPPIQHHPKTSYRAKPTSKIVPFLQNSCNSLNSQETQLSIIQKPSLTPLRNQVPVEKECYFPHISPKSQMGFLLLGLSTPLSSLAAPEATVPPPELASDKISIESILISIDDFINRYPFFVSGVAFIWLLVIPLTKAYLRKYKFTSAIDAFRKLRDDPDCQLLDIRDRKSIAYLSSPNLKIFSKGVVQAHFSEDDEEGFLKKVLENFANPENTTICVLDNFDGNSMKVAELLFKNGFKLAYAIKGGVRGQNGWQEIQETLLPPSVHVYRKKAKKSQQLQIIDGNNSQDGVETERLSSTKPQ